MDTGMRNLEQIQEQDHEEGPGRRAAMLAVAALATVGLVFAMGIIVGDASEGEAQDLDDPLAALDRAASLQAQDEGDGPEVMHVDREQLVFPEALVENQRPEVAAALAAAAAEYEHPDPLPMRAALANILPARAMVATAMPAAVSAGPDGQLLARSATVDPLVAAAIPSMPTRERASAGTDGPYTLQVISYRTTEEAAIFAEALRARGHAAFTVTAEVEGRGIFHRVRIGPFRNAREAEGYRSTFEQEERMNTFVVRRRD